uniref:Uncharacterized protein n=1 Tax=Ditylenchus dipsaci TaxID=166011 RepID=A0A915D413_9BILA
MLFVLTRGDKLRQFFRVDSPLGEWRVNFKEPSTSKAKSSGHNEPNSFPLSMPNALKKDVHISSGQSDSQEIKHMSIDKDGPKFFNLIRAKARIRKHVDNKKMYFDAVKEKFVKKMVSCGPECCRLSENNDDKEEAYEKTDVEVLMRCVYDKDELQKVVSTEQPVVVLSIWTTGSLSQVISQVYVQAIGIFHSHRWNHHFFRSPIRFVMDFSSQSCVSMKFVFYLNGKIMSEVPVITETFGIPTQPNYYYRDEVDQQVCLLSQESIRNKSTVNE